MATGGNILLCIIIGIHGTNGQNNKKDELLDPKDFGKNSDVTIFNVGVIIISKSGAPYDLERTGVAVDMAMEEVNRDILNASYMIQPIQRDYGPVCDAAKAPGKSYKYCTKNIALLPL